MQLRIAITHQARRIGEDEASGHIAYRGWDFGSACNTSQAPWPNRAVRIIVPFGLGGAADVAARYIAEPLSAALGVPVIIENRTGAGGSIGTNMVAKSPGDGYTLEALGNTAAVNETLQPGRGFVLMRDLTPVAPINIADNVLAVHPSVPANTLPEFLELLRREPGKWNYAHSGPGTPYHLAGEMLKAMAKVDMVAVSDSPRSRAMMEQAMEPLSLKLQVGFMVSFFKSFPKLISLPKLIC